MYKGNKARKKEEERKRSNANVSNDTTKNPKPLETSVTNGFDNSTFKFDEREKR